MLPVFLLRCSSMWGAFPLLGSVIETWLQFQGHAILLMQCGMPREADYTPKAQRGRWKALGSITAMGCLTAEGRAGPGEGTDGSRELDQSFAGPSLARP